MSFLEDYNTFTSSLEVPSIFQVWCAYSALSAAAQRKIWIDMGHFQVSPNLYVILVAPPGKCGKSTAMNIVRELLSQIEGIKTKSDSITKEKIYEAMEASAQRFEFPEHRTKVFQHCSLTIFANEMSLLIKRGDKDFVSSLNSLFDSLTSFKHSTKTRGENVLVYPYLNIIGGTTPEWLSTNVHEDVIEGGLSARTVLVFSDRPNPPNPFPFLTTEAKLAKERILLRLHKITTIGGVFKMSDDTHDYYGEWYIKHHNTPVTNNKMAGWWSRKRIHLLKLSMLNALAEHDHLIIELPDMQSAMAVLTLTEPLIEKALRGVGRNVLSPITQDILDIITKQGSIHLAELNLLFRDRVNQQEFKEIIGSIVETGQAHHSVKDGQVYIEVATMFPQKEVKLEEEKGSKT